MVESSPATSAGAGGAAARVPVDRELVLNLLALASVRGFEVESVAEDEDKFLFTMMMTGDLMLRDGLFDPEGEQRFHLVEGPHPMTWGQPVGDVYNAHEAVGSILCAESGMPLVGTKVGRRADGFLLQTFYKDAALVPEDAYARLGLTRPDDLVLDPGRSTEPEFAPGELDELLRPVEERVLAALDAGDLAGADALLARVEDRWTPTREIFDVWPAALVSWLRAHHGHAEAYDAQVHALTVAAAPLVRAWAGRDRLEVADALEAVLGTNLSPYERVDDDGATVFTVPPSRFVRTTATATVALPDDPDLLPLAARDVLALIR